MGSYCIPTGPGQCRLITRFPFRLSVKPVMWIMKRTPRWITHFSQNIILDSDVVFLSTQDERLREIQSDKEKKTLEANSLIARTYYMPARSDTMVAAFRKWLGWNPITWLGIPAKRSSGERLGWIRPQSVPARQGRDALLDRYRQHTDICSSCRTAHRRLCILRQVVTYSGASLLATSSFLLDRQKKFVVLVAGGILLLSPRVLLQPLISRLECVPWPRKEWVQSPSPSKKGPPRSLRGQKYNEIVQKKVS